MLNRNKPFTFFSKSQDTRFFQAKTALLNQLDFGLFQKGSLQILQTHGDEESLKQWQLFCKHLHSFSDAKAEQMMLMQAAFQCLFQPIEPGELAQLITLSRHLKAIEGRRMLSAILTADVPPKERILSHYLRILQLLLDLHEEPGLFKVIQTTLPRLSSLLEKLQILHEGYLAKKYPDDNLDGLIQRFSQKNDLVEFPLSVEELQSIKQDYLAIKDILKTLPTLSQSVLEEKIKYYGAAYRGLGQETTYKDLAPKKHFILNRGQSIKHDGDLTIESDDITINGDIIVKNGDLIIDCNNIVVMNGHLTADGDITIKNSRFIADHAAAKHHIISILAETIRRQFNILPYSTQILSLLALINTPDQLKGRIGQIKTGEGKSTIIAMLAAFMGCQGLFVDVVTSSGYLAIRDCKKYQAFFNYLGMAASHINREKPKQKHFHAQIIFGTNTDFEFAFLRDGLYNMQLRYSRRFDGELIKRTFEAVIVDEVDNFFLDTALSSAQMGIRDHSDLTWVYPPIWEFVSDQPEDVAVTPQLIQALRQFMQQKLLESQQKQLTQFKDEHLQRWFNSAHTACFKKKLEQDYLVQPKKDDPNTLEVTIVDYANTGRINAGCQWQHGIHQFLQLKHHLALAPPTKTAASIPHSAYFNLYQYIILGLTGTMGEAIERKEIQEIYKVGSFDVPPNIPGQRKRASDFILNTVQDKWAKIVEQLLELKKQKLPVLVLFKTIKESNLFSQYLSQQGIKHQLLNETQRESEDYLVDQAGEPGVITIATNTAGRGTDIRLAPESKKAGGLQLIFTFYPDNLRVEGQGFGRAGRQGQPGKCWMVLSKEDENIKSSKLMSSMLAWDLFCELGQNEHLVFALESVSTFSFEYMSAMHYLLNSLRKEYTPSNILPCWEKVYECYSQVKGSLVVLDEASKIGSSLYACYQNTLEHFRLNVNCLHSEINNIMKQINKEVANEISSAAALNIHQANVQIANILLQITPDININKLAELALKLAQISKQIDNIMMEFRSDLIDNIDTNKIDELLEHTYPIYKKMDDLIMQCLIISNHYHEKINAAEVKSISQKQSEEIKNALIQRVQESPKFSIQILDQLRTSRIQEESEQRSKCARKEQMYFSQLQDFFIKMEKVYLLCKSDEFKTQIIQRCQNYSQSSQTQIKLDETHPEWKILKETTQSMVRQTLQGKEVDWSAFTQSFVTVYLAHIRDLWGTYYSKLKDPLEEKLRESAYQQILPYLSNPIQMALAHLDQLLSFGLNKQQEETIKERRINL